MPDESKHNSSSRDGGNQNDANEGTSLKTQLNAPRASRQISLGAAQKAIDDLNRQLGPFRQVQEQMARIQTETGLDTTLGRLAKQISEQEHKINDAMRPLGRLNVTDMSIRDLAHVPEQLNLPNIAPNPA